MTVLIVGFVCFSVWLPAADASSAACSSEVQASSGFRVYLPDCRAYEMVSPASKNGAEVEPLETDPLIQAAVGGEAIAYGTKNPIENDPAGNPEEDRVLSTRNGANWSSQDISTSHTQPAGAAARREYEAFSSDLDYALLQPLKSELVSDTEPLYRRDDANGALEPLVTPANVAPGARQAIESHGATDPGFAGATADLRHVAFSSPEALTPNAIQVEAPKSAPTEPKSYINSLYEWSEGRLTLVSVLPGAGEVPANTVTGEDEEEKVGAQLGARGRNVRHAISENGSRVFWETEPLKETGGPSTVERHLYLRDTVMNATTQIDKAQTGVSETFGEKPGKAGLFELASSNGSVVFFRDGKRLTSDSTAGGAKSYDLYAFDVESGTLADLTPDARNGITGETADVRGTMLGASEAGSDVYFVANGVLAEGATPGDCEGFLSVSGAACNLYVAHNDGTGWTTRFIARVSAEDEQDWGEHSSEVDEANQLNDLTSRVSPDGNYVAFMSERSLTGYDNVDATSGAPDEEVYLYDASANRLVCASCNPTGAPPHGVQDNNNLVAEKQNNWLGRWLAASIPGWSGSQAGYAYHQPRYLSDSGRLFFNSPEGYVPQDSNGVEDVYQYEPEGVEGCAVGGVSEGEGVKAYRGGGCLALISGGTGPLESEFVDASENGNDVFFVTAQSLAPADKDTNYDMYVAHVCSAGAPCPPAATTSAASCFGEACQGTSSSPQVFGAPSSASMSGSGNFSPPTTTPATKPRALTPAQKLSSALSACRKQSKKRRPSCEATARKRYGPKLKSTKSKKKAKASKKAGRR